MSGLTVSSPPDRRFHRTGIFNVPFGTIGKELGKDRTTIAKEVKKYSYDKKSGRPGYPYNPCKHRMTCKARVYETLSVN